MKRKIVLLLITSVLVANVFVACGKNDGIDYDDIESTEVFCEDSTEQKQQIFEVAYESEDKNGQDYNIDYDSKTGKLTISIMDKNMIEMQKEYAKETNEEFHEDSVEPYVNELTIKTPEFKEILDKIFAENEIPDTMAEELCRTLEAISVSEEVSEKNQMTEEDKEFYVEILKNTLDKIKMENGTYDFEKDIETEETDSENLGIEK